MRVSGKNANLKIAGISWAQPSLLFWAVFGLALALRLGLYLASAPWSHDWPQRMISADSFEYFILGKSILERGAFSYTWPEAMPNALRLPLYPFFVAITSLGGEKEFLWLTSLVQLLLDSCFAALLFHIVHSLFSRPPLALGVALLYALSPDAVFWSTQILAESMSVWLMVLAVYGVAAAAQPRPGFARLLIGGLAGGLVPLVKSAWQFFALGMTLYLFFQVCRTSDNKKRVLLATMALLLIAPPAIWITRNWMQWGVPRLSVGGPLQKAWTAKLLMQWSRHSDSAQVPVYTPEMALHMGFVVDFKEPDWIPRRFKEVRGWDRHGLIRELGASDGLFLRALKEHPDVFAKASLVGLGGALFSPQNRSLKNFLGLPVTEDPHWRDWGSGRQLSSAEDWVRFAKTRFASPVTLGWSLWAMIYWGLFYLGTVRGLPAYGKTSLASPWTIYLLTVTPVFFLNAVMAHSRYRLSMMMPLTIAAAWGLCLLATAIRHRGPIGGSGSPPPAKIPPLG